MACCPVPVLACLMVLGLLAPACVPALPAPVAGADLLPALVWVAVECCAVVLVERAYPLDLPSECFAEP